MRARTCCSSCVRAFLAPARLCSMAVNVSFGLPLERFESLDPLVEQGYMFLILLEKGGALVGLRDVGLHRARLPRTKARPARLGFALSDDAFLCLHLECAQDARHVARCTAL